MGQLIDWNCAYTVADFLLGALYVGVAVIAIMQLRAIVLATRGVTSPEKKCTAQKLFLSCISVQALMRGTCLALQPFFSDCQRDMIGDSANLWLEIGTSLPLELFVLAFSILAFKIAHIYHSVRELTYAPRSFSFRFFVVMLVLMNIASWAAWGIGIGFHHDDSRRGDQYRRGVIRIEGIVTLLLALGFALHGVLLYRVWCRVRSARSMSMSMSQRTPVSPVRNIMTTSALATICFLARGTLFVLGIDATTSALTLVLYCVGTEVVPTCLMIVVFHGAAARARHDGERCGREAGDPEAPDAALLSNKRRRRTVSSARESSAVNSRPADDATSRRIDFGACRIEGEDDEDDDDDDDRLVTGMTLPPQYGGAPYSDISASGGGVPLNAAEHTPHSGDPFVGFSPAHTPP
ncbi:MAG: hypothetical protein MHM6MM_001651 [Cercozoa sp. M6MM]